MKLEELLATYGYPIVLFGALAEGETVLIAAGYLARRHYLDFWAVVACAATGGTLGDQGWFFLGRAYGERLIARLPRRLRTHVAEARATVGAHPVRVLVAMRFAYGMRILLPVLCGTSPLPASRYVRYNVATAFAWALLLTGIGFAFGSAAIALLTELERYERWFVLLLVPAAFALNRGTAWLRRRLVDSPKEPRA